MGRARRRFSVDTAILKPSSISSLLDTHFSPIFSPSTRPLAPASTYSSLRSTSSPFPPASESFSSSPHPQTMDSFAEPRKPLDSAASLTDVRSQVSKLESDLREKDTDVGKRVTMLPLPTSTDRSRLAQRTRRGLARLIRRLARRMHDEVHLSELNRSKKVIRCPVRIQPSSSHCMGRSHLHRCERNRLRHCLWLRKRT